MRCPYRPCTQHGSPEPGFYTRFGSYHAKCRSHAVPRFRCKSCLRTFSRQTFSADYRDQKPHLNAALLSMSALGIGIRQCGRMLHLSQGCTQQKLRKMKRHLGG